MPLLTRDNPYTDWELWFAWRPVATQNGWKWLTTVERRIAWNGIVGSMGGEMWWEYR